MESTQLDSRHEHRKKKKRSSRATSDSSYSDSSDENRKGKRKDRSKKDRKGKRHKKKRRRDYSSSSEDTYSESSDDESRSKHKKRKSRHRHKSKKEEKSHHQKHDAKEKVKEVKDLSEEDYFVKNNEFSTWLKEERGLFFSTLSSDKAHELFLEFVKLWNKGQLCNSYYKGISSAPRTDHKWAIKKDHTTLLQDPEEEREFTRKLEKLERKKFQKMHENVIEETLPKATGRERLLEKRKINREKAKEREVSPDLMNEKDLLGGTDDFKFRLQKERMRKQKRSMEKSAVLEEKLEVSRQKEAAAMSQFQAILNEAGGRITIPKRN